nr:hypothetical protein [Tanacetum cinerariifolium]
DGCRGMAMTAYGGSWPEVVGGQRRGRFFGVGYDGDVPTGWGDDVVVVMAMAWR